METSFGSAEAILGHLAKVKFDYEEILSKVMETRQKYQEIRNATKEKIDKAREIALEIENLRKNRGSVESDAEDERIRVTQLQKHHSILVEKLQAIQNQRKHIVDAQTALIEELDGINNKLFDYFVQHKYRDDISAWENAISQTEIAISQAKSRSMQINGQRNKIQQAEQESLQIESCILKLNQNLEQYQTGITSLEDECHQLRIKHAEKVERLQALENVLDEEQRYMDEDQSYLEALRMELQKFQQ